MTPYSLLHETFPKKKEREKVLILQEIIPMRMEQIQMLTHKEENDMQYLFVPKQLLQKIFNRNYSKVIDKLVEIGWLDPIYISNKSKRFNFESIYNFKIPKKWIRKVMDKDVIEEKAKKIFIEFTLDYYKTDIYTEVISDSLKRMTYNGEPAKHHCKRDFHAERFYCYYSNMPSELRLMNMLCDGEEMVELDLAQSQMKQLANIFRNYNACPKFVNMLDNNEDIYSYMRDVFQLRDRKEAKKKTFQALFGHPDSAASKEFYKIFPGSEEVIRLIKGQKDKGNNSKKLHSNLSFLTQREEVKMLEILIHRLRFAGIPFYSVHDSITVKKSDTNRARELFQEVADDLLVNPIIRTRTAEEARKDWARKAA